MYKQNQIILSPDEEFNHFRNYCEELNKVEKFCKSLSINLTGEYDFIIKNVIKQDIEKVLSDKEKQYFVFGDKTLFKEDLYDI